MHVIKFITASQKFDTQQKNILEEKYTEDAINALHCQQQQQQLLTFIFKSVYNSKQNNDNTM
jgi:hypothetical protein